MPRMRMRGCRIGICCSFEVRFLKMSQRISAGFCLVLVLIQLAVVAAPRRVVVQIRTGIDWIGQPINWFEANLPWFSVIHFVIFVLIGVVAHFAFPRLGFLRLFGLLLVFAVLTESLQVLVPGRSPGAADFIADFLGIVVGLGIGFVGSRLFGRSPAGSIAD